MNIKLLIYIKFNMYFDFSDTCHFERLTSKGLESDNEYDFHWTTVPAAVGEYNNYTIHLTFII